MATIKKACKGVSYPKSSSVSGRLGSPSKAKSGKMLKKQAAVAIAMKAAGKKPKMAKGGSFPDLNKDGKVTKKDVLIGRGVLPKTAKKGMKVKKAQMGIDMDKMKAEMAEKSKFKVTPAPRTNKSDSAQQTGKKRVNFTIPKVYKKGGKMTKKCAYGCK